MAKAIINEHKQNERDEGKRSDQGDRPRLCMLRKNELSIFHSSIFCTQFMGQKHHILILK